MNTHPNEAMPDHSCPRDVAVVIPCYNYGKYLGECLDSVRGQSLAAAEVVVVDDGSTDNTREVCEQYPEVTYVWQENRGLPGARNTGLHNSVSEYVLFLDADDLLCPETLERLVDACGRTDEKLAGVFGFARVFGAGESIQGRMYPDPAEIEEYVEEWVTSKIAVLSTRFLRRAVRNSIIPAGCVLLRREVFEQVGLWNETYVYHEDREMWMRILSRYQVAWIPSEVAKLRKHDNNITHNSNWIRNHKHIMRILGDTLRADWASCELRRLVRQRYAISAYMLAQRLADAREYGEASAWMARSIAGRPAQPKAWCRLLQYTAYHAWNRLGSHGQERAS